MIRVVLADDHPIVREGVKRILKRRPDVTVVGEAADGDGLIEILRSTECDVVLLDLSMPGPGGLEALRAVRQEWPDLPVLILSVHGEEQYAVQSIKSGAAGYLTKESAPGTLLEAIDRVYKGGRYITPQTAERLADLLEDDTTRKPHERLSDREFQVFSLLGKGLGPTEIARHLNLSVKTVSTYRSRVLQKMNFSSNADIIRYAMTHGFVE